MRLREQITGTPTFHQGVGKPTFLLDKELRDLGRDGGQLYRVSIFAKRSHHSLQSIHVSQKCGAGLMGSWPDNKTFWIISVVKHQLIVARLISNWGLGHEDFYPIGTNKDWVTSASHMPICASVSLKVTAHNSITQFYDRWNSLHRVKKKESLLEGKHLRDTERKT